MADSIQLLSQVIEFVDKEFCGVDEQDCDCCNYYDLGNCPVLLAKQYLKEENTDDE
ncbi:MAG: hypothetical protein IJH34_03435 [Romboutsia sp.]|nr:hypothetical protein [Romboutsia sp.]